MSGPEQGVSAKRGQQLATALSTAVRTAGYYDPSNAVMQQTSGELLKSLAEANAEFGAVGFSVHSHCVFVNKVRVPTTVSTYGRFASLMELFDEWHINTLTIDAGITEAELQEMLLLLSRTRPSETEFLGDLMRERGMGKVHAENVEAGTGRQTQTVTPLLAYSAAMHLGIRLNETPGLIDPGTIRCGRDPARPDDPAHAHHNQGLRPVPDLALHQRSRALDHTWPAPWPGQGHVGRAVSGRFST
jgi:hypothetical protein